LELLTIDPDKCNRDGICVAECPARIIRQTRKDAVPAVIEGGEESCIACGHCVAVCPEGALSHRAVPLSACPPLDGTENIPHTQARRFLRARRSVRVFKNKPVARADIARLIDVARYAPTASNAQLLEWTVIADAGKIRELAEMAVAWMRQAVGTAPDHPRMIYLSRFVAAWDAGTDSILRGAPVLVTASAPKEDLNGMVDLTLALSYLELAAPTLGLGTCWAGLLQGAMLGSPALKAAVGIPEDHPHHYPMMLGYPAFRYYRLPERKAAKVRFVD